MSEAVTAATVCAVNALIAAYSDAIDAGDFAALGALFSLGRLETASGDVLAEGSEQVEALFRSTTRLHDDGTPRTAHLVSNVVVQAGATSEEVVVDSRFCVMQSTAAVPLQPVVTGRYHDLLVRDGSEWRFARRRMVPELWGDVTDHLTFDPRSVAGEESS